MHIITATTRISAEIEDNRLQGSNTTFTIQAEDAELHASFIDNNQFTPSGVLAFIQTSVMGLAAAIWYAQENNITDKSRLLQDVITDLTDKIDNMKVVGLTMEKYFIPNTPTEN